MNIQIFGTKKCNDTKKTERFFKERDIPIHFRDLSEKGISPGELDNILCVVKIDDLIDLNSKQYIKRGLQYMIFNTKEELLADPLLFKTPIVRNGKMVTVGYQPEIWKGWID